MYSLSHTLGGLLKLRKLATQQLQLMCMGGLQGETWLARHAHVLQAVEKARSGGDMAKALLFVERMLVEQDMMQPHWEQHFQPSWRHSLAKCSDSRQAILYLAALQVPNNPHVPACESDLWWACATACNVYACCLLSCFVAL